MKTKEKYVGPVSSIGFGIVGSWMSTAYRGEPEVGEVIVVNYHDLEKLHIKVTKRLKDSGLGNGRFEGTLIKHDIIDSNGVWSHE